MRSALLPFAFAATLALTLLTGCSSYHAFNGSTGFSDAMVAPNQYQVSYVAPSNGTTTQATRLALIRAAELAVLSDHPYFELLQNQPVIRQNSSYFPPTIDWYDDVYIDRHGRRIYINRPYWSPGYFDYYTQPQAVLQVKMLSAKTDTSLDAKQILTDAVRDHIKIDPAAAQKIGLQQK